MVQVPTDYFPREEFNKIIDATYVYGDPRGGFIPLEDLRLRLRVMTWLMRWSGLRIRDAMTLEKTRLAGDSVFLYQAKTGTPVYCPLPPFLVKALQELPAGPRPNPRYFFWSGNGDPKSAVANWQRAYRRLFEIAAIQRPDGTPKRCHPHMFRDTFAVENLLAGVPIDQVSLLLGPASVKITEKSYAPFVKARQLQLQESVRNAWQNSGTTGSTGYSQGAVTAFRLKQKREPFGSLFCFVALAIYLAAQMAPAAFPQGKVGRSRVFQDCRTVSPPRVRIRLRWLPRATFRGSSRRAPFCMAE